MFFLKKVPWTPKTRLRSFRGTPDTKNFFIGLRGKELRKLCCFTTHNDFFCILARRDLSCLTYVSHLLTQNRKQKSIICCLTNSHIQSKRLCLVVANYSFLFTCEQKTLARVLPKSSAVICARFSGISTSFTAIITKCLKSFLRAFFQKSEKSFSL